MLGDWGKESGPGACQSRVADLMKAYVRKQSAMGRTLLFVADVGDSFYFTGNDGGASWRRRRGRRVRPRRPGVAAVRGVPFLSVMGNHDYGNTDPYALCPHKRPKATVGGQPYGSNQFNADKNPSRPAWTSRFWLPEYITTIRCRRLASS